MEVAGAQAAHLNHSSIFKPLAFLGELLRLSAFCSQFIKWNSVYWANGGGTTVNHRDHKLSFQNALCDRDLIANG